MNFECLDKHDIIGWDIDGTLVGHVRARMMYKYILAHPEKKHYLVTFRSGFMNNNPWPEMVWDDLIRADSGLFREHFVALVHMTTEEYDENCSGRNGNIYAGPTDFYKEWKGMHCNLHGITVLVDDNAEHVLSGCKKYGIAYVDPDYLTGLTTDEHGYTEFDGIA